MKRYLIFIYSLLWLSVTAFSQQTGVKSHTLSSVLSGDQTYTARDFVLMEAGFEYDAVNSGDQFTAETDQSIILDADYVHSDSLVIPATRTLDKTLPVGTPSGSFSVGENGAAIYSIPIEVSPGTAGVQPSISINYSSLGGNGQVGFGWDLSGISVIYRTGSDYKRDGFVGEVSLTASDKFELDGQRLISLSGTYGADGTVYSKEVETFTRITSHGVTGGSGPEYFSLETKNGTKIYYGNADSEANANLVRGTNNRVFAWYIYKMEDANGNYMIYNYTTDEDNGEVVLESIQYTGNDKIGLEPYNEVKFFYQTRKDTLETSIGVAKFTEDKILRRIECYSDGQMYRRYDPKYFYKEYTYLNEMLVYNGKHERYNSLAFSYEAHVNEQERVIKSLNSASDLSVNGDFRRSGTEDLMVITSNGYASFYAYDFSANQYSTTAYYGYNFGTKPLRVQEGDFNGDRISDLLLFYYRSDMETLIEYYTMDTAGFVNYQTSFLAREGVGTNSYIKDLNKDNIDDLILVSESNDKFMVQLGDTTNGLLVSNGIMTQPGISSSLVFGSFSTENNIAIRNGNNLDIYEFSENLQGTLIQDYVYSEYIPSNLDVIYMDYDGDGKTDILRNRYTGGKYDYIGINNGGYFYYYNISPLDIPVGLGSSGYIINDFDGDERDDILNVSTTTPYTHEIWFSTENYQTGNFVSTYGSKRIVLKNITGGGDVLIAQYSNQIRKYDFAGERRPGMLLSIADGMNRKIDITYQLSSVPGWLPLDPHEYEYPFIPLPNPRQLVENYKTTSGFTTEYSMSYSYGYPHSHAELGEEGVFVGFGRREITNDITGDVMLINKTFEDVFTKKVTIEKRNRDNDLYSTTSNYYTVEELAENYYKRFLDSTRTDDGITGVFSRTSYQYDEHMNVTQKVTDHNGLATTTTSSSYSMHGSGFKNLPDSLRVTKSIPGKTDYSRKTRYYYTRRFLTESISDPGTAKEISTQLTYDSTGHVTRTDVVPLDGAASSFSEVTYDNKNRFVTSKTVTGDFTESFVYDEYAGNIVASTDIYGVTTTFDYDGFGALISTNHPLTGTSSVKKEWSDGSQGGDVVKITASSDLAPDAITYLDTLGRTIKKQAVKFEGTPIYTNYEYSLDGSTQKASLPYESGSPTQWSTVNYDEFHRVSEKTAPGSSVSYDYAGLTSTVTNNNNQNTATTTMNGLGQVISVTEPYGTVTYSYNTDGTVSEVNTPDGIISYTYDLHGNVLTSKSLNAGTDSATYNSLGQILSSTNANGFTTTYTYDALGRLKSFTDTTGTTTYSYVADGNGKGQISSITGPNGMAQSYAYDEYGRTTSSTETIDGTNYNINFGYDNMSRVETMTYPSGFEITYKYDANGRLQGIDNGTSNIWTLKNTNHLGQVTKVDYGNGLSSTFDYNDLGQVTDIVTGTIQDLRYDYNAQHLMEYRYDDLRSLTEQFTYDSANHRLASYTVTGQPTVNMVYADNGNITSKTDVGSYDYEYAAHPHAVSKVNSPNSLYADPDQDIDYNHFNKVTQISENGYELNIEYGVGGLRKKTTLNKNSNLEKEKIFVGGVYEKDSLGDGTVRELHYIPGPTGIAAIYVQNGANDTMYYVHKDHLGSFNVITNESGAVVEEMSFDPWGRRRNVSNWSMNNVKTSYLFDRGYTGHEHLDEFSLINMNGRVYDPFMARFLSPDPITLAQDGVSGFNGYSYVTNNPLLYTDPSGYVKEDFNRGRIFPLYYETFDSDFYARGSGGGFKRGSMGYRYCYVQGEYVDNATGAVVSSDEAIDWALESYADEKVENGVQTTTMEEIYEIIGIEVLTTDILGNQQVIFDNKVYNLPFWAVTGSFYSEYYYWGGVAAFGNYANKENWAFTPEEQSNNQQGGNSSSWIFDAIGYVGSAAAGTSGIFSIIEKSKVPKNYVYFEGLGFKGWMHPIFGILPESRISKNTKLPKTMGVISHVGTTASMGGYFMNIYNDPNNSEVVVHNTTNMILTLPSYAKGWFGTIYSALNPLIIKANEIGAKNFQEYNVPYQNFHVVGGLSPSDSTLKDNIEPLENALEKLLLINGYSYTWKQDTAKQTDVGVVAQEVEMVLPEAVKTDEHDGKKMVYYYKIIPVLIEAIKEQQKEIDSLKLMLKEQD